MNLTGKQIAERGIVFGNLKEENIQQHGVDCNLVGVRKIAGGGVVPAEGKTTLSPYREITPEKGEDGKYYWNLIPGVYDITLAQGCKIPADQKMKLIHRSSIYRNGSSIVSALWDAGFETENMGTVLSVMASISIEVGARVCQAETYNSNEVEKLYDGQWQGDSQRTDGREVNDAN